MRCPAITSTSLFAMATGTPDFECPYRGHQPCRAGRPHEDDVDILGDGHLVHIHRQRRQRLRLRRAERGHRLPQRRSVDAIPRPAPPAPRVVPGGERHHFEASRELAYDIDRLAADGASRAEDRHARWVFHIAILAGRHRARQRARSRRGLSHGVQRRDTAPVLLIADGNNLAWAGFHALRRPMGAETPEQKTRAALARVHPAAHWHHRSRWRAAADAGRTSDALGRTPHRRRRLFR